MLNKKRENKQQWLYVLLLLLVVLIWGISPNVNKLLFDYFSPAIKTAFTALIAFTSMLLISLKKLKKLNVEYFKIAVPTGLFYSAAVVMQQIGLSKTTPAMYAFLENLSCLVVPFLAWYMTKIRPSYCKFIATGVCIVSVYVLGGAKLDGNFGIGDLLCGLAGIFYGVNIAVTGVKAKDLDAGLYLLIQFGVNLVISSVYALLFEQIVFPVEVFPIALCMGITLVSSVFGWLIRTICLKHIDPTIVSVIMPLSSVITTIISVIVGNDVLTRYLIVGAILGVLSAIIANLDPKQFKKKRESVIEKNDDEAQVK